MAQRLKCLPATPSWVGKIPWRRKWQPTPVFLPGESHGWRSLVGYSPWSRKESDMTERLHFHFSTFLWLKNFSPLNPWGRVHLPACISHKRPILIIVLLSITLPLTEFLLHWDTKNLSLQKSRHQVSDSNYVYLWLIHVDVWQKPTKFSKAIILQLKKGNRGKKNKDHRLESQSEFWLALSLGHMGRSKSQSEVHSFSRGRDAV